MTGPVSAPCNWSNNFHMSLERASQIATGSSAPATDTATPVITSQQRECWRTLVLRWCHVSKAHYPTPGNASQLNRRATKSNKNGTTTPVLNTRPWTNWELKTMTFMPAHVPCLAWCSRPRSDCNIRSASSASCPWTIRKSAHILLWPRCPKLWGTSYHKHIRIVSEKNSQERLMIAMRQA